jgi:hypothetical protein
MTHDELLAIIDVNSMVNPKPLLEVVKLHKPHDKYENLCGGCWEEESGFSDYPCPTIQVIQLNLR